MGTYATFKIPTINNEPNVSSFYSVVPMKWY